MARVKITTGAALGVFLLLGGCSLAPSYTRPDLPVSEQWPEGAAYQSSATGVPAAAELGWQEFIADEKLRQVLTLALEQNRDLRSAALQVELARARYGIQRDELFPAVNALGAGSRQRSSGDLRRPGDPKITEQYSVDLGLLAWEIDFFGRIRSLKDRALEEYLATEQARRSAQTLLVAAVANAYLALAADREHLALARKTLENQRASYDLVGRLTDAGIVSELDLYRAQTTVEAARSDRARYTQLVAQDINALTLLVGAPVPPALLPGDLDSVTPPREIAAGLPSGTLLTRPDVLSSEALLRAANANIGAARAAFFPRISLTTTLGTASDELFGLFDAGTGTWRFAPQVAVPIFDARTWSGLKATEVQRDIAVVQYEKTIQSAFREVADALAQRGVLGEQLAAQEALVEAASASHRLSEARYRGGVDGYLTVLDAQRTLYGYQQGRIAVRLARQVNQVTLYRVLGGGV